ncbi:MAG: lysophospholipid acyltransferase family protein [Chloroflexota bacterium]
MNLILAVMRVIIFPLTLFMATLVILLLALLRLRTSSGVPWAMFVLRRVCQFMFTIFGVDYICTPEDKATLDAHQGLVFINHLSYLDTMMLLGTTPVRFLSTIGVKRIPFIGMIGDAIDTIYVNRYQDDSRTQVRDEIAEQLRTKPYPPLVLFPEGGVGAGDELLPFRYGAFDIVIDGQFPCLLCVLTYEPFEIAAYYEADDNIPKAAWRLATFGGRLKAKLTVLGELDLSQGLDQEALAQQTQAQMQEAYTRIRGELR